MSGKIVISSSYGNDSLALVQFVREQNREGVSVVFIDTGWSAPGWLDRVAKCEEWVKSIGYEPMRINPELQFEELIRRKKGFPSQRFQWCSGILKGLPFLTWIDEADPDRQWTVAIGKRREESPDRADTPEFIDASDYHGGRRVWHPLYLHDEAARNALLARAGFEPLPHRSRECSPCVNANKNDLMALTQVEIDRLAQLEGDTGQTMFRVKKKGGARGIEQVIQWAYSGRGKFNKDQGTLFNSCSSGYCGF